MGRIVFCLTIFTCLQLWSNPANPIVISGEALISHPASHTCFIEAKDQTIIHWKDFSIGANELTRFIQPSASSVVLNRVTGNLPSQIFGKLEANGHLFLLNQNGILFGKDAVINVAGLTASTLNLTNDDFLKGQSLFFKGESKEGIINHGTIRASSGHVTLLSRYITNSGLIQTPQGNTELVCALEVLLKPAGKERIMIRPKFDEKKGEVGLHHLGRIEAIEAHLLSDGNLYEYAIRSDGKIDALNIQHQGGRVLLLAGNGKVSVTGSIQAPGGEIAVLGKEVLLPEKAHLSVSDPFQPGNIYIGGGKKGEEPPFLCSELTFIGESVLLEANAELKGSGGEVICWSDGKTIFSGHAETKGGQGGGDGGLIEISGKQGIFYQGSTDRFAPNGKNGELLLDPESTFRISTITNYNIDPFLQPTADIANLFIGTLITELERGPVTIKTAYQGEGGTGGQILLDSSVSRVYYSPYTLTFSSTGVDGILWQGSLINTGTGSIELLSQSGNILLTPQNSNQPALIQTAGNLSFGTQDQPVLGNIEIRGDHKQSAGIRTTGKGNITIYNKEGVELISDQNAPALIQLEEGQLTLESSGALTLHGLHDAPALIECKGGGMMLLSASSISLIGESGPALIYGGNLTVGHLEKGLQVAAISSPAGIESKNGSLVFRGIGQDIELTANQAPAYIRAEGNLSIQNLGTIHLDSKFREASIHSEGFLEIHAGKDIILNASESSAFISSLEGMHLQAAQDIILNGATQGIAFLSCPHSGIFAGHHLTLFSNSHISAAHGTLFLTTGKDLMMDNPLHTSSPFISSDQIHLTVGEDLNLNDHASISSSAGALHLFVGHSAYLDESASLSAKGGPLEMVALHGSIHFSGSSEAVSETDGALFSAGQSIFINGFSKIKSRGEKGLTLIVDGLNPSEIGMGGFILADGASLESGDAPLNIYTAKRSYNSIEGTLNGYRLASAPQYMNTKEEKWGSFFPSEPVSFASLPLIPVLLNAESAPFIIYHKENGLILLGTQSLSQENFTQIVINYIGPFTAELFRCLHPYSEYILSSETFEIAMPQEEKGTFSIKRRTFRNRSIPKID